MSFSVIKNNKPKEASHRAIVQVLFQLRRDYKITIHPIMNGSFYHIKQADKVIGFACDQLIAIDKAFDFIGVLPPYLMIGMIERRHRQLKELKEVVYG